MSTREELAARLRELSPVPFQEKADALIAEGWRKKPDADDVVAVVQRHWEAWTGRESEDFSTIVTSSILALMDRGQ